MNALVKIILLSVIIGSVGGIINALIPTTFTDSVNNSIVYFLTAMAPLNFVLPMNAVYDSIQIMGNFVFGLVIFILVWKLIHLYSR